MAKIKIKYEAKFLFVNFPLRFLISVLQFLY